MLPAIPKAVILRQASRSHRMHHFLWHETRHRWNLPENRGGLTLEAKQRLKDLGWELPRPALDATRRAILGNESGEDFLFMHRQMIASVNAQLREIADPLYPRIEGWRTVPEPGDPTTLSHPLVYTWDSRSGRSPTPQ